MRCPRPDPHRAFGWAHVAPVSPPLAPSQAVRSAFQAGTECSLFASQLILGHDAAHSAAMRPEILVVDRVALEKPAEARVEAINDLLGPLEHARLGFVVGEDPELVLDDGIVDCVSDDVGRNAVCDQRFDH